MRTKFVVFRLPNRGPRDEFQSLRGNPALELEWVSPQDYDGSAQVIVLPGSARTTDDLKALRESGGADAIKEHLSRGLIVVGVCGGFQMLGNWLIDPRLSQGDQSIVEGLGYLPHTTVFGPTRIPPGADHAPWLSCTTTGRLLLGRGAGGTVSGEEHRSGFSFVDESDRSNCLPLVAVHDRKLNEEMPTPELIGATLWSPGREKLDGLVSPDHKIWATYLHMIFHNESFESTIFERL
jgi:adenosylcobyric acid synthase